MTHPFCHFYHQSFHRTSHLKQQLKRFVHSSEINEALKNCTRTGRKKNYADIPSALACEQYFVVEITNIKN